MRGLRVVSAFSLPIATMLATFGCSSGHETLPAACAQGPQSVQTALAQAPGPVTLDGTPLSRCLTRRSDASEIQTVGANLVNAAEDLATRARAEPGSQQTLELGYLVAAVRKGAARTQGIHAELVRRVEQELTGVDTQAPAFVRGLSAGRASG